MNVLGVTSTLITFVAALAFGFVGWRLSGRPTSVDIRVPRTQFTIWWYGVAILFGLESCETLVASVSTLSLAAAVTVLDLEILVICAALWGLVGYLTYLYTGKEYLYALTVFYAMVYVLLLSYFTWSDPVAVGVTYGRVVVTYAVTPPLALSGTLIVMLLVPELGAALAYLTLSRRAKDPTLRYRTRMVGGGILLWFVLSLLSSATTSGNSPVQLLSPLLGVVAAVLCLLAQYPPESVRTRWGIRSIQEEPLHGALDAVAGVDEGLWEPSGLRYAATPEPPTLPRPEDGGP